MNCREFEEIARDLAAGAAWPAGARRHAAACAACGARVEQESALSKELQDLAAEGRLASAPPEIEHRLRAAFRAQLAAPARRATRWWPCVAAAAATVVLALAVWPRHAPPAPSRPGAGREGFVALSTAPFESARVVRVRLPRSSLPALGFPAEPDRSGELIQAEVVYADDGIARAIRLLE